MVVLLTLAHTSARCRVPAAARHEARETEPGRRIDPGSATGISPLAGCPTRASCVIISNGTNPSCPSPRGRGDPPIHQGSPTRNVPVALTALASFDSLLAARP